MVNEITVTNLSPLVGRGVKKMEDLVTFQAKNALQQSSKVDVGKQERLQSDGLYRASIQRFTPKVKVVSG